MRKIALVCLLAVAVSAPALALGPNSTEQGSVIVWPHVQASWDNLAPGLGDRYIDTIVSLVNNSSSAVTVKIYLVNGDCQNLGNGAPPPGYVPPGFAPPLGFEPGCVALDCQFDLTPNEPIYWSVFLGSKIAPRAGVSVHQGDICPRFDNLDGDGRVDPDFPAALGIRRLRGYLVAIAVDSATGLPKTWNFLSGSATVVNYNAHSSFEYKAYSYKRLIAGAGVDGVIKFDGIDYDSNWDKLLMPFFAAGSAAYGADTTPAGADGPNLLDGQLTLLPMKIDVTNNVGEFINNNPLVTRATLTAYNENETIRTVIQRCICCWDSGLFSSYSALNNFLTTAGLGTDHGKATIDAKANANCGRGRDNEASPPDPGLLTFDAPLVGVKSQKSTWTLGGEPFSSLDGSELSGFGDDTTGVLTYTPVFVLRDGDGNIIKGNKQIKPIGGPIMPMPAKPTSSR